eukprot:NODE_127_length_18646_cov_0.421632.p5 type:complete len:227 gc:universal NODE_127_length_18646_cov_0.421632:15365-16045(+)
MHPMFTNQYQKELKNMKKKHCIMEIEDKVSKSRTFIEYLNKIAPHMRKLIWFYSQKPLKRWRFRRLGLKQKIVYMVYNELVTGQKTMSNIKLSDKKRRKQKVVKGTLKRAIIWEMEARCMYAGKTLHPTGCSYISSLDGDRSLLFQKSTPRRNATNASKTSMGKSMESERDLGHAKHAPQWSIRDVFISYITKFQKPVWQLRPSLDDTNIKRAKVSMDTLSNGCYN